MEPNFLLRIRKKIFFNVGKSPLLISKCIPIFPKITPFLFLLFFSTWFFSSSWFTFETDIPFQKFEPVSESLEVINWNMESCSHLDKNRAPLLIWMSLMLFYTWMLLCRSTIEFITRVKDRKSRFGFTETLSAHGPGHLAHVPLLLLQLLFPPPLHIRLQRVILGRVRLTHAHHVLEPARPGNLSLGGLLVFLLSILLIDDVRFACFPTHRTTQRDVGRVRSQHLDARIKILRWFARVETESNAARVIGGEVENVKHFIFSCVLAQIVDHVTPEGEAGALFNQKKLNLSSGAGLCGSTVEEENGDARVGQPPAGGVGRVRPSPGREVQVG